MADEGKTYLATLNIASTRKGWTVVFRHPALADRASGQVGRRIHRGLRTTDKLEAERLVAEMNTILTDRSYWSTSARVVAERRFDPRVVSIFFDEMASEPQDPAQLREELIPLPASETSDYRRVLMLGTTGAGKTTLLRQIIGTDPDKDRFPSTSTAKTTVADTELVLDHGPYRAAVTFLAEDEVRDHLEECLSRAVLASYRGAADSEVLRFLLNHVNQRIRFSYVLGTGPIYEPLDEDEEDEDEIDGQDVRDFAPDGIDEIDLERTAQLLGSVVDEIRKVGGRHGDALRTELQARTESDQRVVDELFEEELDERLRDDEAAHSIVDRLMEEVEARFKVLDKGRIQKNRQGWVRSWYWQCDDPQEFLKEIRRFYSNEARLFGRLLTPLVNGLRVAGPFQPGWWSGDPLRLVLLDTEGLGHTLESSGSISTSVVRRFETVDAVLLVDNAAQPMQAAPVAAMRSLVSSGLASKLLICFTHLDLVKGPNLPSARAKEQHVLASAENVLAAIGEDLGPFAERILRRRLQEGCFFVGHIDEELELGPDGKRDRRTIAQLRNLLTAIDKITERPARGPARPTYDRMNLVLAVKTAAEDFHDYWQPKLGLKLKAGVVKEHWSRIKALNRRLAEGWADEYDTLKPVADLHQQLQKRLYVLVQNPVDWTGADPTEDEKQTIFDAFANEVKRQLLELSSRRVWQERVKEWQGAYRLRGSGSTFDRAAIIARDIYERAAPVPDVTPSPDRNEFLHEVAEAVEKAAGELQIRLR